MAGADHPVQLLVMCVEGRRYALPLAVVERVIRAVDVTPLPKAPGIVCGAIDVHGRVLPVLSVRRRLGLADREVTVADLFVLATASDRTVVLVFDDSEGVIERRPDQITAASAIDRGLTEFPGVTTVEGDLVVIDDLDAFLSLGEAQRLDAAVRELRPNP